MIFPPGRAKKQTVGLLYLIVSMTVSLKVMHLKT